MYRNELYHYGVLGMRWGVRRYQPYGSGGYDPKKADINGKFIGSKEHKGLSDKAKKNLKTAAKIAIGIGAVAGISAIGYKIYKSPELRSKIKKGKDYCINNINKIRKNYTAGETGKRFCCK